MGLLSSFLGKDQKRDIQGANKQANAALKQGYDGAYQDYTDAGNYFQPYAAYGESAMNGGNAANTFYEDALGLNGADAAATATGTIAGNPLFQGQLGQDSNAVARMLNAQGNSGGGKAQLAAQRVFQQNASNWLDKYRGAAQDATQREQFGVNTGLNATNAMAGYRADRGNLAYGYGATRAGNAINYGNAMAAARGVGINNILGLASTAAQAYGAATGVPPVPKK